MSGYQQNNGPKIPDPGSGMLRPPRDPKEKSPQFTGLVNYNGQIISMSIWYMPPTTNSRGQQMPGSMSVKVQPYDPNRGQQQGGNNYGQQQSYQQGGGQQRYQQPQQQPPQQQGFNYGQPQQQYQPAPQQQQYAPQQQPQQQYQPAPQAGPAPQYQRPQQGGNAGGNYGGPGSTFGADEVPF